MKIRNYQADNEPNFSSNEEDWQLTRRFFIFDTLSGIRETNENTAFKERAAPEVVRYAKSITLRVTLDDSRSLGKEETIYAPLLEIYYRERNTNYIAENPLTKVSFTAEYSMDTANFWQTENVMFVVICILAGVVLLVKMVAFMMQGNLGNDDFSAKCKYFVVRLIIDSIDVYSNIFFWYLFSITVYWFTFFKW